MKAAFFSLLLTLSAQFALAQEGGPAIGPNPCTPTRVLADSYMSCVQENIYYQITIKSLGSQDLRLCQGPDYFESHDAIVETRQPSPNPDLAPLKGHMEFYSGTFEYSFAKGTFETKDKDLVLSNCIVPMN